MTNALVRREVQSSSQFAGKLGVDFVCHPRPRRQWTMDDVAAIDPDVIELVVQLCTRMGMIMEDASALALDASHEGLEQRVVELATAAQTIAAVANTAQRLLCR